MREFISDLATLRDDLPALLALTLFIGTIAVWFPVIARAVQ